MLYWEEDKTLSSARMERRALNRLSSKMDYIIAMLVFVLGLVVGSFLNVVILRLNSEESIVNARSKCMDCGHPLAWYDLFPLVSFLTLRGKCRYCAKKLSWQYPLVELATGLIFLILFDHSFHTFDLFALSEPGAFGLLTLAGFVVALYVFAALVVIFVFDLRHYIIPDVVIYPAIAVASFWKVLEVTLAAGKIDPMALLWILLPALVAGGFFLFLIIITRGKGMGGGDVKLAFLMGLVLGFPSILAALLLAFVSGAVVGVALILVGKKGMKSMLPFGPFLIFGFVLSYFYGLQMIDWYLDFCLGRM
jgi:prepilin signal peptidase PulO-like enzyme (type II secretory pathway)